MHSRLVGSLSFLALAVTAVACSDGVGPDRSRAAVAGVYMLATVNGEELPSSDASAPVSGMMYLWPSGHTERRVTYRVGDGQTQTITATGTFRVEDGLVVLDLQVEPDAQPWTIRASVDGSSLVIAYPGPADGTIVERYRRF